MNNKEKKKTKEEKRRKNFTYLIVLLILGALVGSAVGELIGQLTSSSQSIAYRTFARGITPGFGPVPFDSYILRGTIGLTIKVNLCTVLGIILACYLYKFS